MGNQEYKMKLIFGYNAAGGFVHLFRSCMVLNLHRFIRFT